MGLLKNIGVGSIVLERKIHEWCKDNGIFEYKIENGAIIADQIVSLKNQEIIFPIICNEGVNVSYIKDSKYFPNAAKYFYIFGYEGSELDLNTNYEYGRDSIIIQNCPSLEKLTIDTNSLQISDTHNIKELNIKRLCELYAFDRDAIRLFKDSDIKRLEVYEELKLEDFNILPKSIGYLKFDYKNMQIEIKNKGIINKLRKAKNTEEIEEIINY